MANINKEDTKMAKFDRIGDWVQFNDMMKSYLEVPQIKYGTGLKFNDLCHYTGLRIMLWNILKYSLRLWSGAGKENDFQKIAHYAQMAWTLKQKQGRVAPFFNEDTEGDYVVSNGKTVKIAVGTATKIL